jgi:Zn-dependent protease with chaperone function
MPLTFEERAAIVERLAAAAQASPEKYRVRVVAWIALGYAIVAGLLAVTIALSAGVTALIIAFRAWWAAKFAWIPVVYAWVIARTLFVRMTPPAGRVLQRREAPKLFAMIDEIGERLRIPRLDGVMINSDMNAMVAETPRFGGIFGWRRHLLIGVPLMITHSTEEMRAVLAHELGHLSGQHGRIGAWSWRVRLTWSALVASADLRGARMLKKLMRWYADRLMLVTLVLARRHEHAADEAAAELTDRETIARTLTWLRVASTLLDKRFWERLWERTSDLAEPPQHPFDELMRRRAEIFAPPYDDIVAAELERKTAIDDTHPSLRARLEHLGVSHLLVGLSERTAAEELLGRTAANVLAECDREWREIVAATWKARHEDAIKARETIGDDTPSAEGDDETLRKRAAALVDLGRDADALALYQTLAARNPTDAEAAFHAGRILVERGDLAGVAHLSSAMRDWRFAAVSCQVAYNALREHGMEKDAQTWAERWQENEERMHNARVESYRLSASDDFGPTTLPPDVQDRVLERCRAARWISKVWIARKNLQSLPTSVDIIAVRAKMFRFVGRKRLQKLADDLDLGSAVTVFTIDSSRLMRRLDAAGARRFLR